MFEALDSIKEFSNSVISLSKAIIHRSPNLFDIGRYYSEISKRNERIAKSQEEYQSMNKDWYLTLCALSWDVYHDKDVPRTLGLHGFHPYNNKIDKRLLLNINYEDNQSGFRSQLYYRYTGSICEYVLAIKGTSCMKDYHLDVSQLYGEDILQYHHGVKIAKELAESILVEDLKTGKAKLYFTGHSLGGGIATLCSMVTGYKAIVFNPAGISANTIKTHSADILLPEYAQDSQIESVIMSHDIVNMVQDTFSEIGYEDADNISARGKKVYLDSALSGMSAHSISKIYLTIQHLNENRFQSNHNPSDSFNELQELIKCTINLNIEILFEKIVTTLSHDISNKEKKVIINKDQNDIKQRITREVSSLVLEKTGRGIAFSSERLFTIDADLLISKISITANDISQKILKLAFAFGMGSLLGPVGAAVSTVSVAAAMAYNSSKVNHGQIEALSVLSREIYVAQNRAQDYTFVRIKHLETIDIKKNIQFGTPEYNKCLLFHQNHLISELELFRRFMQRKIACATVSTWATIWQESMGFDSKGRPRLFESVIYGLCEDIIGDLIADLSSDSRLQAQVHGKATLAKTGDIVAHGTVGVAAKTVGELWAKIFPGSVWQRIFTKPVAKYVANASKILGTGAIALNIFIDFKDSYNIVNDNKKLDKEKEKLFLYVNKYMNGIITYYKDLDNFENVFTNLIKQQRT